MSEEQQSRETIRGVLRMLQAYHQKKMKRQDARGFHQGRLWKIQNLLNGQNENEMSNLEVIWRQIRPEYKDEADAVNVFLQLASKKLDEIRLLEPPQSYSGLL